jgi:Flp pilus assembly protein TadD
MAELAQARKQPEAAEKYLRQAAPSSPEKRADLARFLAGRGRGDESDREFAKARELAPRSARIALLRARSLIESGRLPAEARLLLEAYPRMARTPDDPPPAEARRLLEKLNQSKGN